MKAAIISLGSISSRWLVDAMKNLKPYDKMSDFSSISSHSKEVWCLT